MADSYQGPVHVMGQDGIFLTAGMANLERDSELGNWKGLLQTLPGSAVAGKALIVELEIPEGRRGRAQLTPSTSNGETAVSTITGFGSPPF